MATPPRLPVTTSTPFLTPSLERALARTAMTPQTTGYAQLTVTLKGAEFELGYRPTSKFTFGAYALVQKGGQVEAGVRARLEWGG